jgi:hypothetical protein
MENIAAKTPDNLNVLNANITDLRKKIASIPVRDNASYQKVLKLTLEKLD